MCGLFGVAGNLFQKDISVYHDMMWAGALRGMHGTGTLIVNKDLDTKVIKKAGNPIFLKADKEFNKSIGFSDRVLFGHNRHMTVGEISDDNSHPFDFPIVAGAHNGTLRGRSDWKLEHRKAFDTDSEALYFNINNHGVDKVIPEVEGAWALTWWNKEEDTINFLRNHERPLCYAFSKNGQQMYWASEPAMLRWILGRNGVELADSGIMSLKPDTHVKWSVTHGNETFKDPVIKELKGYEHTFFRNGITDVLEKWTPKHIPTTGTVENRDQKTLPVVTHIQDTKQNQPKQNEQGSNKPNSNAGPPSVVEEKHDNKTTLRVVQRGISDRAAPFEKTAYDNGVKAGLEGKSVKACPHPPMSLLGVAWVRGRNDGLEQTLPKSDRVKDALQKSVEDGKFIIGFSNEYMSEQTFKHRTGGCCSFCDQSQEFKEMYNAKWLNRSQFICSDCIEQTDTYKTILKDYGAVA